MHLLMRKDTDSHREIIKIFVKCLFLLFAFKLYWEADRFDMIVCLHYNNSERLPDICAGSGKRGIIRD